MFCKRLRFLLRMGELRAAEVSTTQAVSSSSHPSFLGSWLRIIAYIVIDRLAEAEPSGVRMMVPLEIGQQTFPWPPKTRHFCEATDGEVSPLKVQITFHISLECTARGTANTFSILEVKTTRGREVESFKVQSNTNSGLCKSSRDLRLPSKSLNINCQYARGCVFKLSRDARFER